MQKIFTPKLIIVLLVTLFSLYLVYPTVQYFALVAQMGENPTAEQEARKHEMLASKGIIKLGLDLQGGASFLLEVEKDRLLNRDLTNEAAALRIAFIDDDVDASVRVDEAAKNVTVTLNEQQDLDFAVSAVRRVLGGDSSLDAVGDVRAQLAAGALELRPNEARLSQRVRESTDAALDVVRRRVDEFGLTQPEVAKAGADRIAVRVPGEDDPARIRNSLLRTAALEFRMLHPEHDSRILPFIEGGSPASFVSGAGTGRIRADLVERETRLGSDRVFTRLKTDTPPGVPDGYVLRLGVQRSTDKGSGIIDESQTIDDLVYLVQASVPLGGEDLRRAAVITDPSDFTDPIKVQLEFNREGARIFGNITSDNVGRRFAIVLDDIVYSAPNIMTEILGGVATITGGFDQAEATSLSKVLKAGALPAPLAVITEDIVGPSLGADSIRDSGKAIMIGGVLIIILMIVVYAHAGFISVLAMALNVLLIMAVLSLLGATLTLSGIGGILLTMGMAVDANILIYERLREELKAGKPLRAAINVAFGRAFTVILDSNVTSLLPALVLVLFEVVEGSIKGFWTAIAIGLLANMYTAIIVTRALMEAWYSKFKTVSVGKIYLLENVKIPWMKYRMVGLVFSGSLTLASVGYLVVAGPSWGIDFTGGVQAVVQVEQTVSRDQITLKQSLDADFIDSRVVKVVNKDEWQVTVPQQEGRTLEDIRNVLTQKVEAEFGERGRIESISTIAPIVGGEFKVTAIWMLAVACAVILVYLAFRFQWIFGVGAVLALLHDVFLAFGIFKMTGHTLTLDIVSALLVILGYSVNDTIVVFDRIRERMQDKLTADFGEVINQGINETLSRTVLTSGSTLMAIAVMYFFGGSGLSDFALILLLGIGVGTYSSVFVASAVVYVYLRSRGHHTVIQAKKATTRVAMPKATVKKD